MALRKPLYDAERDVEPATVCVTGATGYIAAPVIARLLAAGHTVRATCRDPSADAKLKHLKALPGANERLMLFKADLEKEGAFDAPMEGCRFVIHTAAVVRMQAKKGRERAELIDPSLNGVKNVLGSVNRCKDVEKVILTSSVAAVVGDHWERGKNHVYTENDWNTSCTDTYLPYHQAKKVSEEMARDIAKAQSRWTLVVLNPCLVCGPPLGNMKCESVGFMRKILNGSYGGLLPNVTYCVVDVDDVAAAHTLAMVKEGAEGRYLITNESLTFGRYVGLLRKRWSDFKLPWLSIPYFILWIFSFFMKGLDMNLMGAIYGKVPHFDNSKSKKELGLTYIDTETSQNDMVEAMIALGIVKDLRKKKGGGSDEIEMQPTKKRE
ncbi:hypothetical protein BSKO_10878 [Bryopsis sp. KO-2023]|nr:hypothetical protein BSKO_10878 [Bryopsis sp. KO-2023]